MALSISSANAADNFRIMAPSAADGGYAATARALREAMMAVGSGEIDVYYVTGAGASSVGLVQFVQEAKGDGAHLMICGYAMVGAVLLKRAPVSLNDVTPIARLTAETPVIAVPARSSIRSVNDLVEELKIRGESATFAVGSNGGVGHTAALMFFLLGGLDPTKVKCQFFAGDSMVEAIANGSASAGILFDPVTYQKEVTAGRLRLVGITSDSRKPDIDCPTVKEQGIDMVFENWRGVVAAPGITAAQRKRLAELVERAVHSKTWANAVKQADWEDAYLGGAEFAAFLGDEQRRVERVFRSIGMLR